MNQISTEKKEELQQPPPTYDKIKILIYIGITILVILLLLIIIGSIIYYFSSSSNETIVNTSTAVPTSSTITTNATSATNSSSIPLSSSSFKPITIPSSSLLSSTPIIKPVVRPQVPQPIASSSSFVMPVTKPVVRPQVPQPIASSVPSSSTFKPMTLSSSSIPIIKPKIIPPVPSSSSFKPIADSFSSKILTSIPETYIKRPNLMFNNNDINNSFNKIANNSYNNKILNRGKYMSSLFKKGGGFMKRFKRFG